jgi:hypothetical protein
VVVLRAGDPCAGDPCAGDASGEPGVDDAGLSGGESANPSILASAWSEWFIGPIKNRM